MVTLKELAEICNVSVSTVSTVLNGKSKASQKTKDYILETAKKMGYQPNLLAQSLRNSKTRSIALIVDDIVQFTTGPIVESIMAYCEEKGYRVIMYNLRLYNRWSNNWQTQTAEFQQIIKPILTEVCASRVDGVIYVAGHNRLITCFEENFPLPIAVAYAEADKEYIPSYVIDDVKSSKEVMEYLISHGHKKIGFIGGRLDNHHAQQRLQGYKESLEEHGLSYDPKLIYFGEWERITGYEGAVKMIDQGITAIFCSSDKMAGGVYDCLEEKGFKVGKDISVTGFDDELIASYFTPQLTTTRLALEEIGHETAKTLLEILEAEDPKAEMEKEGGVHMIPCQFQERKSVGTRVVSGLKYQEYVRG